MYYSYYCNYCWLLCCRTVGVCWILSGIRAWLQEICHVCRSLSKYPGQSPANFLWYLSVKLELFESTCTTPFLALLATAGQVLAMDAGCGSSTRGHWDGPVTCNKSHGIAAREAAWIKDPCDHNASPCSGHATVCTRCPLTNLLGSLGSTSARKPLGRLFGSVASLACCCVGSKTVLNACFLGMLAQTEVHRPTGYRNSFCCDSCPRCILMHSSC